MEMYLDRQIPLADWSIFLLLGGRSGRARNAFLNPEEHGMRSMSRRKFKKTPDDLYGLIVCEVVLLNSQIIS